MGENETQEIEAPAPEVEESEATTEEEIVTTPVEEAIETQEVKPETGSYQKRINKLTYDRREAERIAEYWKSKANEQVATEPVGKPDRYNFDDEDEYLDALFEYKDGQRTIKLNKQKEAQAQQAAKAEFQDSVQGLINKGVAEFDDYDSVVVDNPALVVSDDFVRDVTEMESGHLVAYYLGKNIDKANEIQSLSPYKRAIALNKIEAQLTAKASKKTTTAPPPIEPLDTTDGNVGAEPTNPNEWFKWRQEQLHRRRKG